VSGRSGFTLIEVMVALVVGTVVLVLGHAMVGAVVDRGRALIAARTALDRQANASRWMASAFLSVDVGSEGAGGFDGEPGQVQFASWQRTPDGWFERRRLSLRRSEGRLVARVTPDGRVVLADSVAGVDFDYLLEPGADSRWVRQWVSQVSAPLAVRMRLGRAGRGPSGGSTVDTLLFLIKERG
jgi:prepilin-type N-terminal cleavage/methylation domain-containing protein